MQAVRVLRHAVESLYWRVAAAAVGEAETQGYRRPGGDGLVQNGAGQIQIVRMHASVSVCGVQRYGLFVRHSTHAAELVVHELCHDAGFCDAHLYIAAGHILNHLRQRPGVFGKPRLIVAPGEHDGDVVAQRQKTVKLRHLPFGVVHAQYPKYFSVPAKRHREQGANALHK